MKNILLLILSIAVASQVSCRKKQDAVSKVVDITAPDIRLNGEKFVTLNVGQAYEDPGAQAVDDISGATTNISADVSTLDVSTPGLYYMGYSAKNANGYVTNVARYIAVTDYADNIDLSGVYVRAANGVEVNITRMSRGLYRNDDMGGAGLPDAAYFAVIDEETIDLGLQLSESLNEEIDGFSESLTITAPDEITIQYALDAPGYGTAVRTFEKAQ